MKFWKYFSFTMFIMEWFSRASADGKIDGDELAEVIAEAVRRFDLAVDLPNDLTPK